MKSIPRPWRPTGQMSLSIGLVLLAVLAAATGLARGTRALNATANTVALQDRACADFFQDFRRPETQADSVRNRRAHLCADSVDDGRRGGDQRRLGGEQMRLAMTHSMIPEYHDEQRLPDGAGGLGPRAALYASPYLDDFTAPWQFDAHGSQGILVAYVVVEVLPAETIPGTYTALGLDEGMNCVYLARGGGRGGASWRAIVRHALPNDTCSRTGAGGTTLFVRPQSYGTEPEASYPAVARFGLSRSGAPLLGVKCLDAWCEIGAPEGGAPFDVRVPLPQELGVAATRYNTIKGWHDEQYLSVRASSGRWRPTPIRAAIVPAANVGDLPETAFVGTWTEVATVYLDQDPPPGTKYYDWGLRGGPSGNVVRMRSDGAGRWQGQVTSSAGTFYWFAGKRERHYDVGVPGTVRFRWTILDDAIWTPCGQACCRIEGY